MLPFTRAFYVWYTTRDMYIDIVAFDAATWNCVVQNAERFFYDHVLPEINTRRLSRKIELVEVSCGFEGDEYEQIVEIS